MRTFGTFGIASSVPAGYRSRSQGAALAAEEMNRLAAEKRKNDEAAREQMMRDIEADAELIRAYGRHDGAPMPAPHSFVRVSGERPPQRSFGSGRPAPRPSTTAHAAAATSRPSGRTIDSVAVYAFRNSGVRPTVASVASAKAPRSFGELSGRVYGDATPSFIVSSARGGAA